MTSHSHRFSFASYRTSIPALVVIVTGRMPHVRAVEAAERRAGPSATGGGRRAAPTALRVAQCDRASGGARRVERVPPVASRVLLPVRTGTNAFPRSVLLMFSYAVVPVLYCTCKFNQRVLYSNFTAMGSTVANANCIVLLKSPQISGVCHRQLSGRFV